MDRDENNIYITSIKATHVNREIFGVAHIVEWSSVENMSARYFILIKYLREYSHISFVHMGPFRSQVWRERLRLTLSEYWTMNETLFGMILRKPFLASKRNIMAGLGCRRISRIEAARNCFMAGRNSPCQKTQKFSQRNQKKN